MQEECYWVYILLCDNNAYYTGYTTDLKKRYLSHVNGTSKCKFTRSFKPIALAQCWQVIGSKAFAMQLERQIKKYSREQKELIIANPMLFVSDERVKVAAIPETSLNAE